MLRKLHVPIEAKVSISRLLGSYQHQQVIFHASRELLEAWVPFVLIRPRCLGMCDLDFLPPDRHPKRVVNRAIGKVLEIDVTSRPLLMWILLLSSKGGFWGVKLVIKLVGIGRACVGSRGTPTSLYSVLVGRCPFRPSRRLSALLWLLQMAHTR